MGLSKKVVWRAPIAIGGILILLAAMWGGLLRMGWRWPGIVPLAVGYHGALMVGGFFGTVISMERSVALGKLWTYGAPIFSALGGLALLVGLPMVVGQSLMMAGSLVMVVIFILLVKRQHSLFMITMGFGAIAWAVGNALWMWGWPIHRLVIWWVGFLVLTIYGERLELCRFTRQLYGRNIMFSSAVVIYCVGTILSLWWIGLGWFITGLGMLAMVAWLLVHDLALRTVRQTGMPRFAAVCLLSGYFWLALGGILAMTYTLGLPLYHGETQGWIMNAPVGGFQYDSMLHAILLGFVFAMIFGHAPIIFPAVLGIRMSYHFRFYAHLLLLEVAVGMRIVADWAGWFDARQWSGVLGVLAIVLFLIQTVSSISFRSALAPPSAPASKPASSSTKPVGRVISLGAISVTTRKTDSDSEKK